MHTAAQENYSGHTSIDKKAITGRKFTGNPMRVVTRSGCGHKRQVSQRSLLDLWEEPYVKMARLSEVK